MSESISGKQQVLSTGLNGLVGSKFAQLYSSVYDFRNLDVRHPVNPVDITNYEQVEKAFAATDAQWVVHFAAFTDVAKAMVEQGNQDGITYQVNVEGTRNIVKACEAFKKSLIHISTAFVFDGNKPELYVETDTPNPIEWYGETKLMAEQIVQESPISSTILRIDQPFRRDTFPKPDAVHRIMTGLTNGTLYPQFANHYFGPTYIEDLAKILDWVMRTKTTGLFHATSGEQWTDYEFAKMVQKQLQLPGEVKPGDLDIYLQNNPRPYQRNTALSSEKLQQLLDFKLTPIKEAVAQVIVE